MNWNGEPDLPSYFGIHLALPQGDGLEPAPRMAPAGESPDPLAQWVKDAGMGIEKGFGEG